MSKTTRSNFLAMAWTVLAVAAWTPTLFASPPADAPATSAVQVVDEVAHEGIRFQCSPVQISALEGDVTRYLTEELHIARGHFRVSRSSGGGELGFVLDTPPSDTDTLTLADRPVYDLETEIMTHRRQDGRTVQREITSRAEIALALMQHGDEYALSGEACSLQTLVDHIGVRQNVARWATVALQRWIFPEEWVESPQGSMTLISRDDSYNPRYWNLDTETVKAGVSTYEAIADAFLGSFPYEMGCGDATKLVFTMAILDYYRNLKHDARKFAELEARMQGSPLTRVDGIYDHGPKHALISAGRFVTRRFGIPPNHWVPGDWGYLQNADGPSSTRPGYEGSNVVYLGRGYFDNYFGDRPGAKRATHYFYSSPLNLQLEDHLLEIYHWRYGIMENWANDPRRKFLTEDEVDQLRKDPRAGGEVRDVRDGWGDR